MGLSEEKPTPFARVVWGLVTASLAVSLAATAYFVLMTIRVRLPYWGEAEVIFEASRLRSGLALYIDPLIGAHDYGEPPSRYYVTYPPLWTWVVARVSEESALLFGRLASTLAWFGALGTVAWSAPREQRREAILAAAFVAGVWVLTNFATVGRPDSIACLIAAIALSRVMRNKTVDEISIALLLLVPWVKPTIIGLPVATIVAGVIVDPSRKWRTTRAVLVIVGVSLAVAKFATGGALFAHVVRSNAQPLSAAAWLDQVPSRLPFFAPLFAWAAWVGYRDRADPGTKIGLAALLGGLAWTLFALAKTGSSSNYWMEPCIAAVVLIARAAKGPLCFNGKNVTHALIALGAVLWTDVGSIGAAIEHTRTERQNARFVASVRARCDAERPGDVIAADEAGIELALNGRILTPTYQMVHLVRRGAYPASIWKSDLASPTVKCFVEHTHHLRLAPELERALEERFVVIADRDGYRLWKRR